MNRRQLLSAAWGAARVRVLGERVPLAARIQVTNRCSLDCRYCTLPDEKNREMSTGQIEAILADLARLSCQRVSFSGGEPLLRPDIARLVDRCAELGISPEMNSCGVGFARQAAGLSRLKLLKLSLDGPEAVHDDLARRPGSFAEVMEAVAAARQQGIRTVLTTTITALNIAHLPEVLAIARVQDVMVAFQPLKIFYKGTTAGTDLLPEPEEMRRAVAWLLEAHRGGLGRHMRNSEVGLRHLERWPEYSQVRCWAGRIFCIIGADGSLYPCDRTELPGEAPSCLALGVEEALRRLPEPDCAGCGFCGALELNLALALEPRIAGQLLRLLF